MWMDARNLHGNCVATLTIQTLIINCRASLDCDAAEFTCCGAEDICLWSPLCSQQNGANRGVKIKTYVSKVAGGIIPN